MRTVHFQRVLGSGAFGSVYLAELVGDRGFRRPVAIKVLLDNKSHGEMFLARVRDEARLLGLLQDDHILKVLELAKVENRDAVVMEYVEGVDLAAIVEMGMRPPPRALAELGGAVAGALHRAHQARHPTTGEALNVIHRDVKPANVMVTDRGNVKLLDFGVARARFESRESHTGQFVLGTLNYMAPEYIVTGEVSPAADIYGLALTVWEAASGEIFGQPKLREDLHVARVEERLQVLAGTHAELVPILRQMLAWDPKARPDGASIERTLLAATDMLRGTGLRSWAADTVPKVLAKRTAAAKDECGLLHRTVSLGEAADPVPPPPPDEATLLSSGRPAFLDPPARGTGPGTAQPAAAPPPPPQQAPKPAAKGTRSGPPAPQGGMKSAVPGDPGLPSDPSRSTRVQRPKKGGLDWKMLLLQGLLLGGGLGVLLLLIVGVLLLARGLP